MPLLRRHLIIPVGRNRGKPRVQRFHDVPVTVCLNGDLCLSAVGVGECEPNLERAESVRARRLDADYVPPANLSAMLRGRESLHELGDLMTHSVEVARAHRAPPDAASGSESSVRGSGAPELETGNGGSCGASLLARLFAKRL